MIDRNDPRLTAYALGELEGDELVAFENQLVDDPGARDEVEAIRAMAGEASAVLTGDDEPGLDPERKRAIEAAAAGLSSRSRWLKPFLLAAAIVLAAVLPLLYPAWMRGPASQMPKALQGARERDPRAMASKPETRKRVAKNLTQDAKSTRLAAETKNERKRELAQRHSKVFGGARGRPIRHESAELIASGSPAAMPKPHLSKWDRATQDTMPGHRTEAYDSIRENGFRRTAEHDTSTFSIDVDTASYSNVRRFLTQFHKLPPSGAVRIEELINYFDYAYEPPADDSEHPFREDVEIASCPWNPGHRLMRIALKGKELAVDKRPASNLVFLVDVSGSMQYPNKLPLVKQSLRMLTRQLDERDHVAMVVCAGSSGVVLPATSGDRKSDIVAAIDRLQAGGSTNGGAGIELAYSIASDNFVRGGVNRVILATDGDWNVGITDRSSLTQLIEAKAKTGVYLTVLGFGTGNYKDATMEELSNKGNGNYAYIDTLAEARKVLVDQLAGTLVTIAKDVKIQIFFNPKTVAGYRLLGYENRLLAKQDFNDDKKDAGEIGAGHAVTALYELVLAGDEIPGVTADANPFVAKAGAGKLADLDALCMLRLRYKQPDASKSRLLEDLVFDSPAARFDDASEDFRFASCVAMFGMLLRNSPNKGAITWDTVLEIAATAHGRDRWGYRAEFVELVRRAKQLAQR